MPAELYLRPEPRAFFLLTDTHALVFRQPDASESKVSKSVVVAEFLPLEEVDTRGLFRASRGRTVEGVLGITSVPTERSPVPEIFLLLASTSTPLSSFLPSSSLRPSRLASVEFHCLSSNFWDSPDLASTYPEYDQDEQYSTYTGASSSTQSLAAQQGIENPCNGMRKYLESGGFFYAEGVKWDISARMGDTNWIQTARAMETTGHPLESYDERFVWNSSLLAPLLAFRSGLPNEQRETLDHQALIIPVIQGFCGSAPITTGAWDDGGRSSKVSLGMISRLSWKRAGARFRTRGIDDDGQVANFVETELILATESVTLSYTQAGLGTLQQKVEITRPPQASQPAFDRHFIELLQHYHSIHAVNLLGQKDAEAMLSAAYSDHLASLQQTLERTPPSEKEKLDANSKGTVKLTPYDFHATVRIHGHEGVRYDFANKLAEVIRSMQDFGWTAVDTSTGQIIEQQSGVFRVNCLDCLDRTNYVQDVISSITLSRFLESIGSGLVNNPTVWSAHRALWADNGDRLSKIYAGTGALNTSATRSGKKTFAGLLSDATKSVGRAYINNFQDKGKQAAIDLLLGMMAGQRPVILFDPISDSVQSVLASRIGEYSRTRQVTLFCGTWNLNGKAPDEPLDEWLFPPNAPAADIYAIAFQEIVELTPGQILATDPAKRRMWEKYIMDSFEMRQIEPGYILYRSEQLVGTALIIVVKTGIAAHIRRVESATKKTGLQGLSGNKGGVGIRLELYDSSLCLMTCHLAAGHSNVAERNADYRTISTGLRFQRGKTIDDHEIVIWFADFNYRISLSNQDVREFAETGQLDPLLGADQLLQAMDNGEVFGGYDEGPITFPPTYKYDNGSDIYDSSEKQRIPAWTDRVLFKGPALRLKEYKRADLRTSDHRPVYAIFDCTIREVDHIKKDSIAQELLHTIRLEADSGILDGKIETSAAGRGIPGIIEGLTNVNVLSPVSGFQPRTAGISRSSLPPRPPRPSGSTDSPSNAPALPPRPLTSTKPQPTGAGFDIPGKTVPPVPVCSPSMAAAISSPAPSLRKRVPPPVPLGRDRTLSSASAQTISPTLTPSSTGDYMLVSSPTTKAVSSSHRAPPPLPSRLPTTTESASDASQTGNAKAQPRPSLDMNGPPPDGLISPVSPDAPKAKGKAPPPVKPKPALNGKADPRVVAESNTLGGPPEIPKKPVGLRSTGHAGM